MKAFCFVLCVLSLVITASSVCGAEDNRHLFAFLKGQSSSLRALAPFRLGYSYGVCDKTGVPRSTIFKCELLALKDGRFIASKIVMKDGNPIGQRDVRVWTGDAYYVLIQGNPWRLKANQFEQETFIVEETNVAIERTSPVPKDIVGMGEGTYSSVNVVVPCAHLDALDYLMTVDRYCIPKSKRLFLRWCDVVDNGIIEAASECLFMEDLGNSRLIRVNCKNPGVKFSIPCDVDVTYEMELSPNENWRCSTIKRKGYWEPEYIHLDYDGKSKDVIAPEMEMNVSFSYEEDLVSGILPSEVQEITRINGDISYWKWSKITEFQELVEEDAEEAIALFPLSFKGFYDAGATWEKK